jgi:RNA polymerase sigma-70 factor (ECF subfamily)
LALIVAPWKEGKDQPTGAEEHDSVHRAIDALPPQQRAAIVLRVIEGLDYAEIAATLGCPVGAVRANLHLARKKVRQMLGEEQ